MSKELLPCPFCGGVAGALKYERGGYIIRCLKGGWCRAEQYTLTDLSAAASAWNRRTPDASRDVEATLRAERNTEFEKRKKAEAALAEMKASREAEQRVIEAAKRWAKDYADGDEASHSEQTRMALYHAVGMLEIAAPAQKPEPKEEK